MLKNQLPDLINQARKERNETRLLVLQNAEIADREHYNEATENKVLLKLVASHKDSISQFASLIEKEQAELDIINEFAPKEASIEDIEQYTVLAISQLNATSMKDMKAVLAFVQKQYPTADGKLVSKILKASL